MSKEWHCEDCCCFGTDACHYQSMESHYIACEHLCVDHDKAYQQGREDAEKDNLINACINQLKESDADEVKVSADTKDGYRITVIVELKGQKS